MSRFVKLTPEISVQYWLEFIGAHAEDVAERARAGGLDVHYEDEREVGGRKLDKTARIYLQGSPLGNGTWTTDISFDLSIVEALFGPLMDRSFAKLQLKRENNARAVCFRPTDESPMLTGFGQQRPGAKPWHQDFSPTYVDRRPGALFKHHEENADEEEQMWRGFDPLYVKVKPADGEEYVLDISTDWTTEAGTIFVSVCIVGKYPDAVPAELAAYVFKLQKKNSQPPADLAEIAASAVQHRPRR